MTGKKIRLNRIRDTESKNILMVPMDHGLTLGPIKGLKNTSSTIREVAKGGGDSVLMHKGSIKNGYRDAGVDAGLVMHLNGATSIGPNSDNKVMLSTVEEAIKYGADAVSVHINAGSMSEHQQIQDLGEVAEKCEEFGMPLVAMMYARGPDIDSKDPETVAHAARMGAELGADVVKTSYTGDKEEFEEVIEGCPVPVVVAGGPKRDTKREVLEDIRDAMDVGARGVSMGRNVFQQEDISGMVRSLSKIIHDDSSVDEAVSPSLETDKGTGAKV